MFNLKNIKLAHIPIHDHCIKCCFSIFIWAAKQILDYLILFYTFLQLIIYYENGNNLTFKEIG